MRAVPLPARDDLERTYRELQFAREAPEPVRLVLWAQWARVDARLAEILVKVLESRFREINPFNLWQANAQAPCPQALAVLVDFARLRGNADPREFRVWKATVLREIKRAPPQMFFVSDGLPRPERQARTIARCLRPYKRWGFFGDERIAPAKGKARSASATILGSEERGRMLEELIQARRSFSVEDYVEHCGGRVHRRTAERDLARHPRLRARGHTRGRTYERR